MTSPVIMMMIKKRIGGIRIIVKIKKNDNRNAGLSKSLSHDISIYFLIGVWYSLWCRGGWGAGGKNCNVSSFILCWKMCRNVCFFIPQSQLIIIFIFCR